MQNFCRFRWLGAGREAGGSSRLPRTGSRGRGSKSPSRARALISLSCLGLYGTVAIGLPRNRSARAASPTIPKRSFNRSKPCRPCRTKQQACPSASRGS